MPRAFLIDDDSAHLDALSEGFERRSFTVLRAQNGEEALRLLQALEEFDVAMSDYEMPDIKGDEVLRQVGLIRPAAKRIFMSGRLNQEPSLEGRVRETCDPHLLLPKPLRLREVLDQIEKLLTNG